MTDLAFLLVAVLIAFKLWQDGFWTDDSPRHIDALGIVLLIVVLVPIASLLALVSPVEALIVPCLIPCPYGGVL